MTGRFASLERLMAPRSVAVVGASAEPLRIGGRPIAYMLERGYAGRILPVNPRRAEVQGLTTVPDVSALPEPPDAAVIAVPGEVAVTAIEQLAAMGCGAAVVLSSGFAEVPGEAGRALQDRMTIAARAHGMRLLGPNCLGVFNDRIGYYPMFSSAFENGWPLPGRVGVASQSGAIGGLFVSLARDRGIGTSLCITTGNEADVTVADAIGWLAEDEGTDVIAAYAEGITDGEGFVAALAAARAARKPVVMLKAGRSALGGDAARSHTAAIAGNDAVTDAVLREFGVLRARGVDELMDWVAAATHRVYPAGNTLGVITTSGGGGVLVSDAAEEAGLPMPPMPEHAQASLLRLVPFAAARNPVDCTGQAVNDLSLLGQFIETMVAEGDYRSVLGVFAQTGGAASVAPALRAQFAAVRARHPGRLYAMQLLAPPDVRRAFEAEGFLVFEDYARAVSAIAAMGRLGNGYSQAPPVPPPPAPAVILPPGALSESEAKALLEAHGIPCAPERACTTAEEAVAAAETIGYPVVLKILSPDIIHKSEIGGVLLDVTDAGAVRAGYALLLDRAAEAAPSARITGVLVARQLRGGTECVMGIHRDPVFGPVAMFGLGGIFVELLQDVVFHRCPFDEHVAERLIRSIRGIPVLTGARGRPRAEIPALARMLACLSRFAVASGPTLEGVDLNPVLALPDGAFALDAVITHDYPSS